MTLAARIVVVAVDGEDGDGDVDVRVLVVDGREGALEDLVGVGEELDLARLGAQAVLAEAAHHLVERLAGGLVVVEEVAAEEHHVDLVGLERYVRAGARKWGGKGDGGQGMLTSSVRARFMISSKVFQLSSLRIRSRSS